MQVTPPDIPGMIEPVEQELLFDVALGANLGPDEVVCEFGAFFGRSTFALAVGLLESGIDLTRRKRPPLVTYDIFSCSRRGMSWQAVIGHAQSRGLQHLLKEEDGRIDFLPVFDHFMSGLPPGLLARHACKLADATHDGAPIAAMHIDAPKWREEYVQLLRAFGPSAIPGCQIVFQDFFFHWSATLVAMVQIMAEEQLIEPLETAASSLLVKTTSALDAGVIARIEAAYEASDPLALVSRASQAFAGFDMDRHERFWPRLSLAGLQLAHETQRAEEERAFRRTFETAYSRLAAGSEAATRLLADLKDLTAHSYSLRRLYEQDVL